MFCMKIRTKKDTNKIILPSIDDVPREYWIKLTEKRVFFGHQSVGYNILDGIRDVASKRDYINLNIIQTDISEEFDKPIFAHAPVGRNMNPSSKINAFKEIMNDGIGAKVDMAFFKFCYIDIMKDSNPQKVFDDYTATIEELIAKYPGTIFLHLTIPLCSMPKSAKKILKELVKSLLGKPGVLEDNMKRQCYNTLLNNYYSKTDSIFDLALLESVNPDGFRCYADKGEKRVFVMVPQYTDDGGHLNERGREKVAEQLLIKLAKIAHKR
jgi:hypothetical protein